MNPSCLCKHVQSNQLECLSQLSHERKARPVKEAASASSSSSADPTPEETCVVCKQALHTACLSCLAGRIGNLTVAIGAPPSDDTKSRVKAGDEAKEQPAASADSTAPPSNVLVRGLTLDGTTKVLLERVWVMLAAACHCTVTQVKEQWTGARLIFVHKENATIVVPSLDCLLGSIDWASFDVHLKCIEPMDTSGDSRVSSDFSTDKSKLALGCRLLTSHNCQAKKTDDQGKVLPVLQHHMHQHCAQTWILSHGTCPCGSAPFLSPKVESDEAVSSLKVRIFLNTASGEKAVYDLTMPPNSTFQQVRASLVHQLGAAVIGDDGRNMVLSNSVAIANGIWSAGSSDKLILSDFVRREWQPTADVMFGVCHPSTHAVSWSLAVVHHATTTAKPEGKESEQVASNESKKHILSVQSTATIESVKTDLQAMVRVLRDKQRIEFLVNEKEPLRSLPDDAKQQTLLDVGWSHDTIVHVWERDTFPFMVRDHFTRQGLWSSTENNDDGGGGAASSAHRPMDVSSRWSLSKLQKQIPRVSDINVTLADSLGCAVEWYPPVLQSDKGMSSFLSCLYMLSSDMARRPAQALRVTGHFRRLGASPAAVYGLYLLATQQLRAMHPAYKAALSTSVHGIVCQMMGKAALQVDESRVFENSRVFFAGLVSESLLAHAETEVYSTPQSMPTAVVVTDDKMMVDTAAAPAAADAAIDTDADLRALVGDAGMSVPVWRGMPVSSESASSSVVTAPTSSSFDVTPSTDALLGWKQWTQQVNEAMTFRVSTTNALGDAPKPSLALDQHACLAINSSRGKGASDTSVTLFRPLLNDECDILVKELDAALKLIPGSDADAFEFVDTRDPEGAILLVLDTSMSMNDKAGFIADDGDGDEEEDDGGVGSDGEEEEDEEKVMNLALPAPGRRQQIQEWIEKDKATAQELHAAYTTLEWVRLHPDREQWRQILLPHNEFFGIPDGGINAGLREVLQYMYNFLPSSRPHILVMMRFAPAFDQMLRLKAPHAGNHPWIDYVTSKHQQALRAEQAAALEIRQQSSESPAASASASSSSSSSSASPQASVNGRIHPDPSLLCSMCMDLMKDPSITDDGHSYCRACIQKWFERRVTSPLTGKRLASSQLRPNHALRSQIEAASAAIKAQEEADTAAIAAASSLNAGTMTILIKTLTGKTMQIGRLSSQSTTRQLQQRIESQEGIPWYQQRLIFAGKQMEHDRTLGDYNILEQSTLHLILSLGGCPSSQLNELVSGIHGMAVRSKRPAITVKVCLDLYGPLRHSHIGPVYFAMQSLDTVATLRMRFRALMPQLKLGTFAFWRNMEAAGDGRYNGRPVPETESIGMMLRMDQMSHQVVGERGGDKPIVTKAMRDAESPDTLFLVIADPQRPVPISSNAAAIGNKKRERAKRRPESLNRLETVKQLFGAFINRSLAYGYAQHIGALTFNDKDRIDLVCPITSRYETFRQALDQVKARGDTAIFDALERACEELLSWKQADMAKRKNAKLRILCLSDGNDSCSANAASHVARLLQQHDICLDVVRIGMDAGTDRELLTLVRASTQGYYFHPRQLVDALQLCELETMLAQNERPDNGPRGRAVRSNFDLQMLSAETEWRGTDPCSEGRFPPRKMTYNMGNRVASLETAVGKLNSVESADAPAASAASVPGAAAAAKPSSSPSLGPGVMKRLLSEMRQLMAHPHSNYEVFPNEDDMTQWAVLLKGPDGTPYAGGCWVISLQFGDGFPGVAPEVRFQVPIKHCNVNQHGRVCHSILSRAWTQETTIKTVLDCIYGLLLSPDTLDPLDSVLAMLFYRGDGIYETRIVDATKSFATATTYDMWRKRLMGEKDQDSSSAHHDGESNGRGRKKKSKAKKAKSASSHA